MASEMQQMKETAAAHLRRDILITRRWACECEPCREIRSLIGIDKLSDVRPLVREIEHIEEQLGEIPDGAGKQTLLEHYLALYDKLANAMAK